jgi:L-ascorbate metabolism protein UlaG (beta-lactamase superfamily)
MPVAPRRRFMKFTQVRHATCIIELDNVKFIVDPILYKKHELEPIDGGSDERNPLVDISSSEEVLANVDAILLTHLHQDHFDPSIFNLYGKDKPFIASVDYRKHISDSGFRNAFLIKDKIYFKGIEIVLTNGKHGLGIVGIFMGKSYGFVLKPRSGQTVYVTGDTVWCEDVEKTLETCEPKYIVAFAGSAKVKNTHITLDANDVKNIMAKSPNAKIIANHMDSWNHCVLHRDDLKALIESENLLIPADGETIEI